MEPRNTWNKSEEAPQSEGDANAAPDAFHFTTLQRDLDTIFHSRWGATPAINTFHINSGSNCMFNVQGGRSEEPTETYRVLCSYAKLFSSLFHFQDTFADWVQSHRSAQFSAAKKAPVNPPHATCTADRVSD